jgi:hypothetical protein
LPNGKIVNTRHACHMITHTHSRIKRAIVRSNSMLEWKILSKYERVYFTSICCTYNSTVGRSRCSRWLSLIQNVCPHNSPVECQHPELLTLALTMLLPVGRSAAQLL